MHAPDSHATSPDDPHVRGPSSSTLSPRALAIGALPATELERVMRRGRAPVLAELVGWQFRGMNTMAWARAARIKKFIKGFFRRGGEVYGYNLAAEQNPLSAPWRALPDETAPRRFGYFRVAPVDPTVRDNHYLSAVLLDYGRGGNPTLDPTQVIRDYLVQVDPSDPDLLLGKATLALGPARPAVGFFVLERYRPGPSEL